jgi:putative hemolysin
MEILIIVLLILLNGLFSMSEIAIVSSRKIRLQAAAKARKGGASAALDLSSSPERFLSTVQIGITLIGLLTGIYSGENITNDLEEYLNRYEYVRPVADGLAVTIVLLITTFFTVILGELVPKRIGLANPEAISLRIAPAMKALSIFASPFVWIFTRTSDIFVRLFNLKPSSDMNVTEEEIREVIQEATSTGEIQKIEQHIVERVFLLGDRKISSLMTPRRDLTHIDVNADWAAVRNIVKEDLHRIYPVYERDRDNIIGVVSLKDLFVAGDAGSHDLRTHVTPAHYLSENTSAFGALEKFKDNKTNYALVFNEYGGVQGIVTMDDILLALVGHVSEFQGEQYEMKELPDGSWLVDGQYPLTEFFINLNLSVDPEFTRILTVAGLVLELLDHMPETGERIYWHDLILEVVDMDRAKIDKISVRRQDRINDTN